MEKMERLRVRARVRVRERVVRRKSPAPFEILGEATGYRERVTFSNSTDFPKYFFTRWQSASERACQVTGKLINPLRYS